MADTDRFQPDDLIEYVCRDQDPAAPAGGWVPGTFQRYLPWPPGRIGSSAEMKAAVLPHGPGATRAIEVPIGELRFPPPAPGPVQFVPAPSEDGGDERPTVINGLPVVSAFRLAPDTGREDATWRVIARDSEGERDGFAGTPATYTVTRVRWTPAAPDIADGEWQDVDADVNEGFRGLTWTDAADSFARMNAIDAYRDED